MNQEGREVLVFAMQEGLLYYTIFEGIGCRRRWPHGHYYIGRLVSIYILSENSCCHSHVVHVLGFAPIDIGATSATLNCDCCDHRGLVLCCRDAFGGCRDPTIACCDVLSACNCLIDARIHPTSFCSCIICLVSDCCDHL